MTGLSYKNSPFGGGGKGVGSKNNVIICFGAKVQTKNYVLVHPGKYITGPD